MPNYVDPKRFAGKPLTLRTVADADASVMIDGLRAGRIMEQVRAGQGRVFFWTLTAPYMNEVQAASSGEAESLEDAKAAIRKAFDAWLTWALSQEKPAVWHG